jgi:hypothetical protein
MRRIQIRLSQAQERAVRRRAAKTGSSIAGVVRDAIDRHVVTDDGSTRYRRVLEVFGRYKSTARDVSERHDRYLADAFER